MFSIVEYKPIIYESEYSFEFGVQHLSPQTASSSGVSTNIHSDPCKRTPTPYQSSSQKLQAKSTPVSMTKKKASNDRIKKIQVLNLTQLSVDEQWEICGYNVLVCKSKLARTIWIRQSVTLSC